MTTRIHQHQPTREEVLEVVDKRSVYEFASPLVGQEGKRAQGLTAADVAEHIFVKHHGQVVSRMYENRTSALRKGVNVSRVKRLLADLAEDGEIFEVSGDHWSLAHQHGSSRAATYYFGKEAANIALHKAQAEAQQKREKMAQQEAEKRVLARHADEVKKEWETLLSKRLLGDGKVLAWPDRVNEEK